MFGSKRISKKLETLFKRPLHSGAGTSSVTSDENLRIWPPLANIPQDIENFPRRYAAWAQTLAARDALPVEYIIPVIRAELSKELPPSMRGLDARFDAEMVKEMQKTKWGYYFDLGNGQSTLGANDSLGPPHRESRFRSLYRMDMIGGGLTQLLGDELKSMDVLDLACNWGAFSLDMAARGAKSVTGVDLRDENIAKAEMLTKYTGAQNVNFRVEDVYKVDQEADLVLNLGLMYHVTQPYELVKKTYDLTRKVAVIETITHKEPFSGFVLGTGAGIPLEHAAGAIWTELHPTYRALVDLMKIVGFKDLVELEATPDPAWTGFEKSPLGNKTRRAIVGFK